MKKASRRSQVPPTPASLRELPEIELAAFRVRRNPYAGRIRREGVEIVHEGPSKASLAELPEMDFSVARVRANKYATRAAESVTKFQYGRGRPRRGDELGPTPARSVRLPLTVWKALETEARERRTTVHALLREVIGAYVARHRPTSRSRR